MSIKYEIDFKLISKSTQTLIFFPFIITNDFNIFVIDKFVRSLGITWQFCSHKCRQCPSHFGEFCDVMRNITEVNNHNVTTTRAATP